MPPAAPTTPLNYSTSPSLLPYTLRFHPYNPLSPSPSSSSAQEVHHTHRLCGAGAGELAEAVAGDQAWGLSRGGVGIIEVGRVSGDGGSAEEEGTAGVGVVKDSHKFFKGRDAWRKYTYLVEVETTTKVEIDPEEHEDFVWATEEEVRADRCGERVFEWTSEHQKMDILRAFEIARGKK
ncbi:hypothetical protein BDP81DRAFT_444513 [Colletotrichum phormii]|uniref:Nudix hydrolase domain-containing protein n=1 Tax=Colletotrichum phormii TaxID=359342 RepID=A0AAJ0ELS3_9PEZI|nr:uncharacterized protein BDP81DRAFT_444513 [Colletotrichum phormii]KAK1655847.1 hypothetical protein BDP81DRAFT_444513 [Colletotrichum phormii]